MPKKIWVGILIAIMLISCGGAGIYFYRQAHNPEKLAGGYATSDYGCLWETAQKNFEKNDYLQTIECIEQIEKSYPNEQEFLKKCPDNIGCLQLLAKSFQNLKQYEKAEKCFKKLLGATIERYGENHFSVATAYYGLGSLLLEKQLPDDARSSFTRGLQVLETNPQKDSFYEARIFWGLARSYEQKKNYKEAIYYAKKSLTVTSTNPIPEQQQKLNSAIEKWEQFLIAP